MHHARKSLSSYFSWRCAGRYRRLGMGSLSRAELDHLGRSSYGVGAHALRAHKISEREIGERGKSLWRLLACRWRGNDLLNCHGRFQATIYQPIARFGDVNFWITKSGNVWITNSGTRFRHRWFLAGSAKIRTNYAIPLKKIRPMVAASFAQQDSALSRSQSGMISSPCPISLSPQRRTMRMMG